MREGRRIDVALAVFDVTNVTFPLKHPQDGPDRGIAGPARKTLLNFESCRLPEGIKNIHNLPLAATQIRFGMTSRRQPA